MPMQHDVLVHVRWSEHCCLELQGTVYDSPLGHGLGFLRGWRSWSLSVYSGRPRHRPRTVKRTLNLLSFFFTLFPVNNKNPDTFYLPYQPPLHPYPTSSRHSMKLPSTGNPVDYKLQVEKNGISVVSWKESDESVIFDRVNTTS